LFKRTCGLCFLNGAGEVVKLTQEKVLCIKASQCYPLRKEYEKDVGALKMLKPFVVNLKTYGFFDSIAD